MVAGQVLLPHDRNVMVSSIHGRTHQVHRAGVHTDIFLISMLLMDRPGHQTSVGSHHKPAQLCIKRHVAHPRGNQHLFIHPAHAVPDDPDVIGLLIRAVRNPDPAGQIDEFDMASCLLLKFYRHFKQDLGQHGIILISHRIAGKKGMDPKFLRPFFLQDLEGGEKLLPGHPVLGISRVVHDIIADLEKAARIEPAADGLRDLPNGFLQKINMSNIVQIDDRPQFMGIDKLFRRRVVGGKHNIFPHCSHGLGEHKLCIGRAVAPAPVLS